MTATSKATKDLHSYFTIKRVDTEQGSYLECNYQEGTRCLDMQGIQRENVPVISAKSLFHKQKWVERLHNTTTRQLADLPSNTIFWRDNMLLLFFFNLKNY
ncbi:hypothetical protein ACJMK2_001997 [Sinanodonta woodiana]|uniref:Uncharacterized protein n=1 Tax=Sinanodonta woodiana TaxID=1069815 RepID=A0ABD3XXB9_SINWO